MNVSGSYVTGIYHPVKEKTLLKNTISFTRRDHMKVRDFMEMLMAVPRKRQLWGKKSNHVGRQPSYAVPWHGNIAPSRPEDEAWDHETALSGKGQIEKAL